MFRRVSPAYLDASLAALCESEAHFVDPATRQTFRRVVFQAISNTLKLLAHSAVIDIMAIPLTTVFTPPASCLASFLLYITYGEFLVFPNSAQTETVSFLLSTAIAECFPSGYQSTSPFSLAPSFCPAGYHVVCQTTFGLETSAICCPRFVE
jgi:hypothetical protein